MSTHSPTTINVPLDSRVVLSKRRSGWVRYIGKIKNEAGEWYGIALNEGKGENDGTWEKERYFDCPAHHGVFVRRKEIFCVKEYPVSHNKGPPSPVMHDNSDAGSSTGSSVDSQDTPPPPSSHSSMQSGSLAPPVPVPSSSMTQQAASVITPLIRTFKSFRKELGLQISPSKASSNNNSSSSSSSTATSTASPKSSTAANSSRSSGLRSPSSTRLASFASASPTNRTASIVSQMMVTPVGNPSEAPTALTHPKSQDESPSHQQPHQREEQHQQQKQQSLADLMDDGNGISSVSDLYSGSAKEELHTAAEPFASPPSSRTSSQSTRVATFSSTTAVETIKSSRNAEPAPAPLFFRYANVGSPTLGRRASFSMTNSDNGGGASSPMGSSGKTSPTPLAATTRMAELEKEINVMKTNHENIVAVLRATNRQHAANVLELRAQVAALTEGNHWLEKQLASKNALIAELHAMETSDDRVPRAEVENIIAIKDAQIQTLEREIAKLKQRMLRLETEKDSILCQQVKHFRLRQESDEARIHKLREDVLAMVSGHTRTRNCKFDYELLPCEPVLCVMAVQRAHESAVGAPGPEGDDVFILRSFSTQAGAQRALSHN